MTFTGNPQFGSGASLIANSSNPTITVPLMRTILPSYDAGFFTTSHTVTSVTCARNPQANPKNNPARTNPRFINPQILSSRSETRVAAKILAARTAVNGNCQEYH